MLLSFGLFMLFVSLVVGSICCARLQVSVARLQLSVARLWAFSRVACRWSWLVMLWVRFPLFIGSWLVVLWVRFSLFIGSLWYLGWRVECFMLFSRLLT